MCTFPSWLCVPGQTQLHGMERESGLNGDPPGPVMVYNSAGAGVNIHASGPFPPPASCTRPANGALLFSELWVVHHLGTCPQLQPTAWKPAQRKVEGESSVPSRVGRQVFQFEVSSLRLFASLDKQSQCTLPVSTSEEVSERARLKFATVPHLL